MPRIFYLQRAGYFGQFLSFVLLFCFYIESQAILIDTNAAKNSIDAAKNSTEYKLYKSGQTKYLKGDLPGAKADYENSLKANPIFFPSMIGLAELADKKNDDISAKKFLDQAYKVAPNSAIVITALGKYFYKRGNFNSAADKFKKAIRINPKLAGAHTELAVLYLVRFNKPHKAIEHYQSAIKLQPEKLELYYGLSSAQALAGKTADKCADRLFKEINNRFQHISYYTEYPISYTLDTGQLVSGWIDLLLETDEGFILIDHKASPRTRSDWDEIALGYSGQLKTYADGVTKITGKLVVSRWIHFAVTGGLVEVI